MTTAGEKKIQTDIVVLALDYRVNNKLYDELFDMDAEVNAIGDADTPRRIIDAIQQANEIAGYV